MSSSTREKKLAVQNRQMVTDLHKSGNGYKKIHQSLNVPLSTGRTITQKCKGYGGVENLTGRGYICILPPRISGRLDPPPKNNHGTIAGLAGMSGSPGFQKHHQTPPPSAQALWKCGKTTVFSDPKTKKRALAVCERSFELRLNKGVGDRYSTGVFAAEGGMDTRKGT